MAGKSVQMGRKPPPGAKPPDPSKPYVWIDGRWVLLASDTADGVPGKLFGPSAKAPVRPK